MAAAGRGRVDTLGRMTHLHPPIAARHPFTRSFHGYDVVDDYEWLRDKESAETKAYLEAENAYLEQETAGLKDLQEQIFEEIKSRVQETDMSVPVRSGDWWYFGRTEEGKSYGISCRVPATTALGEGAAADAAAWTPPVITAGEPVPGEEVILDANVLAQGHEFFALGASSVTTSGRYVAYSIDTAGDERFTLRIKDLTTGADLPDEIAGVSYGAQWAGEEFLFYQRVDEAWRPYQVWRHKVGTPTAEDVLVFEEKDERFWPGIGSTRSEKFLVIGTGSKVTSEVWVLEMDNPTGQFRCLRPREEGVEYDVDHAVVPGVTQPDGAPAAADRWLIMHNKSGSNFELAEAPVYAPDNPADPASPAVIAPLDFAQLTTLVPHRPDVRLEGVDVFAGHIVLGYRSGGIGRVAVMRLDGVTGYGTFAELDFEEELYTAGTAGNPEWEAPVLRMVYTSFTTPSQVFDYVVETGERILRKEQEVLGGYDKTQYTATRLWATARDGARIPISLVHRTDLDLTQPNPLHLYGYGSYESSIDPGFSVTRLSELDRGVMLAIAHVRGGGEMGRPWYDTGKALTKKNTFTDFLDVAQHLVDKGVTTPEQMVAEGGSAGGLLMGAVANMGADLFAGILAVVPFVDPLTSMLKPELPLTVTEWDEWGDPLHDKAVYEYMASYAPYENIEAKAYPNILAVTSINDTRVLYVEPAKWIAKLRATATSGQFLLKTEMAGGHGGGSGRYKKWRDHAFEMAWLITQATAARGRS